MNFTKISFDTERLRIHPLREDRLNNQSGHRFQDQPDDQRSLWRVGAGFGSRIVGLNGLFLQLFRTRQPRHLHRTRPVHRCTALPPQPDVRRSRSTLRLVLRLRRGYVHWAPHGLFPDRVLRGSVAGH